MVPAQVVCHTEDVADVVVMFGDRLYTCGGSSTINTQPVASGAEDYTQGQRDRASQCERETL